MAAVEFMLAGYERFILVGYHASGLSNDLLEDAFLHTLHNHGKCAEGRRYLRDDPVGGNYLEFAEHLAEHNADDAIGMPINAFLSNVAPNAAFLCTNELRAQR
jgi:hypothetical protein